jgi:hypothetical protein
MSSLGCCGSSRSARRISSSREQPDSKPTHKTLKGYRYRQFEDAWARYLETPISDDADDDKPSVFTNDNEVDAEEEEERKER